MYSATPHYPSRTVPMLRDFQADMVARVHAEWASGRKNTLMVMPTGSGKCLGAGTQVMMFDGSVKPVEDVRQYELLRGPDAEPRVVMSLARGRETMYRITPTKGAAWTCNESHILSLKLTPDGREVSHRLVNISVREYVEQNRTFKHRAKLWRTGADYPYAPVPLDPHFFGLWLGDGTSTAPAITKPACEVAFEVYTIAAQFGCQVSYSESGGRCPTWHIYGTRGPGGNPVTTILRRLDVLSNKHIPPAYLFNSRAVRLEVLAGLLDSDGYLGHSGYGWISVRPKLAEDVVTLARSLGLAAYMAECTKSCQGGFTGTYWCVSISGDCSVIPCRIPRKKCPPRQQIKDVLVTGFKIEKLPEDDYFGFELHGPDRLFLLGDFTVTHNTKTFCHIVREQDCPARVVCHRNELVSQSSLALAREEIRHAIDAPSAVIHEIVRAQVETYGRSFYHSRSHVRVGGVNTLAARNETDTRTQLVVMDEAHHVLADNVFGKVMALYPNARGLFPTAHAVRADGRGLGRGADGLADALVVGPSCRDLINRGYLTDYRLACPASDVDVSDVPVGPSGELNQTRLRAKVHESKQLTGDIVGHYKRFAPGKLGITFTVDIEAAKETKLAYDAAGIRAEIITGETPTFVRAQIMRRFRAREILQLVSVDVLGEGVDVPAVEVISLARHTASWQLFCQQIGRGLRVLDPPNDWHTYTDAQRLAWIAASAKPCAMIIDHVGNVARHYPFRGLPDSRQTYSLDAEEKRSRKARPLDKELRVCLKPTCMQPFERVLTECPYCKTKVPAPARRATVEQVDGDLTELDPETLAALRAEVDHAFDLPRLAPHAPAVVVASVKKNLNLKFTAQMKLREVISLWAGWQKHLGVSDAVSYRRFFLRYGRDVMTAQTLNRVEADALCSQIQSDLSEANVQPAS